MNPATGQRGAPHISYVGDTTAAMVGGLQALPVMRNDYQVLAGGQDLGAGSEQAAKHDVPSPVSLGEQQVSDRSGYLQEVADFQDAEAIQERPLVVIVTSRIMVVDRVDVPQGTSVVKLDTFTDDDISDWLRRWKDANSVAIADRRVRALTFDAALLQPELARQPLLLLMLAIYAADPTLPPLDATCRRRTSTTAS